MNKPVKINKEKSVSKYCSYCDFRGIIINPHYIELGENALSPCPKCIQSKCRCGGEAPYYYLEEGIIKDCYCRETRIKIEKIKTVYFRSGIDKKFQWYFINKYEPVNKQAEAARAAAYDIIMKFPDVKKGLYLWGNPGTGKTLLSIIILTELITRYAVEGRFVKISRNLFNKLRSSFIEGNAMYGKTDQIEQELIDADILVLDDFGVQRDSPWEQETLYNLVDARYEAEKFTIFTSNSDPRKTLKELSAGRIFSRIKEMCRIMEISGPDQRDKL